MSIVLTFNFEHIPHCVKSVRIWSYSDPYFHAIGLNTSYLPVFSLNM